MKKNYLFLNLIWNVVKRKKADYISVNNINYGYSKYATTVCNAFRGSIYIGSDLYIYPCGALNLPEFKCDNMREIKGFRHIECD